MHPTDFLRTLEDAKIVTAIAAAEQRTSGQIRVWVSRKPVTDALDAARRRFKKLRMARTKGRNGVLLYFAPRNRLFAIVGDTGVHEKCGDEFWQKVTAQLTHDIREMPMTDAMVNAVRTVGDLLAAHFPHEPGESNELPDKVERD